MTCTVDASSQAIWTLDEKQLQDNLEVSVAEYGDVDALINRRAMLEWLRERGAKPSCRP